MEEDLFGSFLEVQKLDKNKIRHKKRWSQIMYMYYFLGHRLEDNMNLTDQQKKARKHNTYLLALDGDVDFQVKSVSSIQIINGLESWFSARFYAPRPPIFKVKVLN